MKKRNLILILVTYCAFIACNSIFIPSNLKKEGIENNFKQEQKVEMSSETSIEETKEIDVVTITFGSKKSIISPTFYEELNILANNINKPEFLDKKVIISGFTDLDEDLDTEFRFLSIERAREVQKFLIEKGVSSEKIYVEGHSKQYLNSNSSLLEKAQNRRVEIKII